jgi:nucleoside-diphosphate-sugar epimerase
MGVIPRIVVTGAAGFIGRRVVARLAGRGRVVALDRVEPAERVAGVEYVGGDLHEGVGIEQEFVLVHLAWNMERGSPEAQSASVDDFKHVLEHSKLRGVVGLGSAEEYGELEGRLSEEMAPGSRMSAYGWAKNEACMALRNWAQGGGGKGIWVRPFIAYGAGQMGDMAIPYALRCARERRAADFSAGLQCRDFVHVDDVADGIVAAAARLKSMDEAFAVCNLGCGEPVRLRDVLERIAEKTGSHGLFRFGTKPMRVGEPAEQVADLRRAEEWLGWKARTGWREGIDELCREAMA